MGPCKEVSCRLDIIYIIDIIIIFSLFIKSLQHNHDIDQKRIEKRKKNTHERKGFVFCALSLSSVCLFFCLPVCLSCFYFYRFICLSVCLSVCKPNTIYMYLTGACECKHTFMYSITTISLSVPVRLCTVLLLSVCLSLCVLCLQTEGRSPDSSTKH